MINCQACLDIGYLSNLADDFINADRRACIGESSETTDPDKWEVIDMVDLLCIKHKSEFLNDYDL